MYIKLFFCLILLFSNNIANAVPCNYMDLTEQQKREVDEEDRILRNSDISTFARYPDGSIIAKIGSCGASICPVGYKMKYDMLTSATRCVKDEENAIKSTIPRKYH